jgi:hypothetical protein
LSYDRGGMGGDDPRWEDPDSDVSDASVAPRIVVVQAEEVLGGQRPEVDPAVGRPIESDVPWIPVGAMRWEGIEGRRLSIVIKMTTGLP